ENPPWPALELSTAHRCRSMRRIDPTWSGASSPARGSHLHDPAMDGHTRTGHNRWGLTARPPRLLFCARNDGLGHILLSTFSCIWAAMFMLQQK
ncbi:hypothetical protein E2562_006057, partial [Oryza meyeriana var. granulata]